MLRTYGGWFTRGAGIRRGPRTLVDKPPVPRGRYSSSPFLGFAFFTFAGLPGID